jgi:exonuclease VII small subunit
VHSSASGLAWEVLTKGSRDETHSVCYCAAAAATPAQPDEPTLYNLEAIVDELETKIADLEAIVHDLESRVAELEAR